jgi:hypothetical protein
MRRVVAYQTSDGAFYSDEAKAEAAQEDIIGAELDGLLRMFELEISRVQEHRALLKVLKKKKELRAVLKKLLGHLEHGENANE